MTTFILFIMVLGMSYKISCLQVKVDKLTMRVRACEAKGGNRSKRKRAEGGRLGRT